MNTPDFAVMLGNLSKSLMSVQTMISGIGYMVGIAMVIHAFQKFKESAETSSNGGQAGWALPSAYLIFGAFLIYLPSALNTASATLFGSGSLLQYNAYDPYDINAAVHVLIQTAGLVWFIRGCVVLAHSSHPGGGGGGRGTKSHFHRGLGFMIAGIMAVNVDACVSMLDYFMTLLNNMVWNKPS